MITIALDEGGHFERISNSSKCMFVGGVIFKYKSNSDCKQELQRLQKFFQETCQSVECRYPEDLHYNRIEGKVVNGSSANFSVDNIVWEGNEYVLEGKVAPGMSGYFDVVVDMNEMTSGMRDTLTEKESDDNV